SGGKETGRARVAAMSSPPVFCGACREPVEPDNHLPIELRSPCPACGGMTRHVEAFAFDSVLPLKDHIETRTLQSTGDGRSGWTRETIDGDNFHRDSGEWRRRHR